MSFRTVGRLEGQSIVDLLTFLPQWSNITTIVVHEKSVFEFKGRFPKGFLGHGFYNLDSNGQGFEAHINIDSISQVELESGMHRGRDSHLFHFKSSDDKTVFKVFLGREPSGEIISSQHDQFTEIAETGSVSNDGPLL